MFVITYEYVCKDFHLEKFDDILIWKNDNIPWVDRLIYNVIIEYNRIKINQHDHDPTQSFTIKTP